MDIQWVRDNLETEELLAAKPAQITVESEAALPGGELNGNRITVDGKANFHALYAQGDMKRVQALEASADLSQALPLQKENTQQLSGRVTARARVMKVTGRVFGGRMLLQAVVALSAEAAVPRSVSYLPGHPPDPDTFRSA